MKYALPFVLMLASFSTFFTSVSAESISFDDGRTWSCDQSFTPVVLRYGYYQGFFDTFRNTNTSTYTNYINTFDVNYKNANYAI